MLSTPAWAGGAAGGPAAPRGGTDSTPPSGAPPRIWGTGPGTPPNDPTGSTIQTLADLIAQGAAPTQAPSAADSTPMVVPVSSGGGGLSILPILLIGGIGFAIYWFVGRKKKEA